MKVQPLSVPTGAPPTPDAARADRLHHAAREFEAVFVRQILAQAKIAGKSDAYAGMAIDAVASAVTAGTGLGLGRMIEDSLSRSALAATTSKSAQDQLGSAVPPR